ncbi:hypothetical protein [Shewanella xiamenensis]|uniref:hypothetical protein n=1 Tax=Shewanella xiamenensis TaxID=332186 RepID=UPI002E7BE0FD|nr:hypothetical protein [Shewanella xiamenensis]
MSAQVLLIGNGSGEIPVIQEELTIRFNGQASVNPHRTLTVYNGKLAQAYLTAAVPHGDITRLALTDCHAIESHSTPEQQVNGKIQPIERQFAVHSDGASIEERAMLNHLSAIAIKQEQLLGAWPSSGFAVLGCLMALAVPLRVCRMNLLPSLKRESTLSPRMPMPAVFHNWLGERRLAIEWLIGNEFDNSRIDWPSFWLPAPSQPMPTEPSLPVEALLHVTHCSKAEGQKLWQQLASSDVGSWLENLTNSPDTGTCHQPEVLLAAEKLFYLPRNTRETALWWLYDNEASVWVSQVHYKLAWLWQTLALRSRGLVVPDSTKAWPGSPR